MRLIDADKIQYAKDWVVTDRIPKVGGYNAKAVYTATKEQIDALPTVDAVPVVRCRECRWHDDQNGATGWMPCREMQTPNDYYCASGERKDGEHEEAD